MTSTRPRTPWSFLSRRPHLHDGRFPHMDSLRAFAALSIVVFHYAGYMALPPEMDWLHSVVVRLGAGVLVFFVISGFLIYRPFVRANLAATSRPEATSYAKRRFLRIVPAYFLALTVTAALVGKSEVFGPDGFLYYGFAQIYKPGLELKGLSVAWSLCIEVTLYAFLPIWAWLVAQVPARTAADRHRREIWTLAALLALGIGLRLMMANSDGRVGTVSILAYLDIFALGMVLAYLSVAFEGRKLPSWLGWVDERPGVAWIGAAICIWAMATQTGANRSAFQAASSPDLWLRHGLSALLGVLLVLPLAFGDQSKGGLRRFLGTPVLLWAGVVSYGLYLFHPVVLRKLSDAGVMPDSSNALVWLGMLLVVIAITASLAALSWHFLERPVLDLKNVRLLSEERPVLPVGPRVALAIGGLALAITGLAGTGYEFIDFVLIASGAAIILGVLAPSGRPRPAVGLLAGIGVVAAAFAIVPGILVATRPASASASSSPFPQRAFLVGVSHGGRLTLYLNGKQVATGNGVRNLGPSAAPFEIGGVAGSRGWNGSIDDVTVWKGALTLDQIRRQYVAGSRGTANGLPDAIAGTTGLVRWYRLGDVAKGIKDSKSGKSGRKVGSIAQTTGHVAVGDGDGGALKVVGTGRVSTPPLLNVDRGNMTVGVWVQNGSSISNRAIMGAENGWLMKTDLAGHWSFGVKDGTVGHTILSPQSAQRFVPGAAAQVKAAGANDGVSVAGLLAALLVAIAAALCIPSVRRRVLGLFGTAGRR